MYTINNKKKKTRKLILEVNGYKHIKCSLYLYLKKSLNRRFYVEKIDHVVCYP